MTPELPIDYSPFNPYGEVKMGEGKYWWNGLKYRLNLNYIIIVALNF